MGRGFAALAAIAVWLGWFSICPAFGLPSLGPAAMFNRVLAPRADASFLLGWALVFIGLAIAALVYFAAVERRLLRPGIASGLAYGVVGWLVAGAIVMPILGLADPIAVPPPPAPPEPMHGSFMMLHLGLGAPLASLFAWLMFGTVLGAGADWRPAYPVRRWALLFGVAAAVAVLVGVARALPNVPPASSEGTATRALGSGRVDTLPDGPLFISVFRLPQAAGATLGPHAHVPGFACTLRGVATMSFADAPTMRVAAGEAGFMAAQQVHTHLNTDDRLAASVLGILLVAGGVVVAVLGARRDRRLMSAALAVLIVVGGMAVWNPWSNDWFFVSVRPAAGRGGPMPLPTASRTYESPDLVGLPTGPYVETVDELTVAPGSAVSIAAVGASLILVLDGQAVITPSGQAGATIGIHQATLVQPGSSVQVAAAGNRPARLLQFTVAPVIASASVLATSPP